jgi:small subunit ribosomal protein S16
MLAIRLARVGKKNKAQFKIVLQEHTVAPGGRHVEILGSYDPHLKKVEVAAERVKYWLEKGAQMSDTTYNLMVSKGVITGEKRKVKIPAKVVEKNENEIASEIKPKEKLKEEVNSEEAEVEEKPKEKVKLEKTKPEEKKAE